MFPGSYDYHCLMNEALHFILIGCDYFDMRGCRFERSAYHEVVTGNISKNVETINPHVHAYAEDIQDSLDLSFAD